MQLLQKFSEFTLIIMTSKNYSLHFNPPPSFFKLTLSWKFHIYFEHNYDDEMKTLNKKFPL